jgi:hypothetical protein
VQLLRAAIGILVVFLAIGLMGGRASHPAWWITTGYVALTALLAVLISAVIRRHSSEFERVASEPIAGVVPEVRKKRKKKKGPRSAERVGHTDEPDT